MEIILVRHGETFANTKNVIQGQMHGKLTERGRRQARTLAKKLKNVEIEAIFSSDLRRSSETAQILADQHRIPVYRFKWLRGRDSGLFEGKKWEKVVTNIGNDNAFHDVNFRFGGGESLTDMGRRLSKFINGLISNYDGIIVICTHRHCISMLLGILFEVPLADVLSRMKDIKNAQIIGNAEMIDIVVENGTPKYLGNNRNVMRILAT